MAPDHKKILAETDKHLDDLSVRDPTAYEIEERHYRQDNQRLGYKVARAPAFIRRKENRP
jgi:hypothetical protein